MCTLLFTKSTNVPQWALGVLKRKDLKNKVAFSTQEYTLGDWPIQSPELSNRHIFFLWLLGPPILCHPFVHNTICGTPIHVGYRFLVESHVTGALHGPRRRFNLSHGCAPGPSTALNGPGSEVKGGRLEAGAGAHRAAPRLGATSRAGPCSSPKLEATSHTRPILYIKNLLIKSWVIQFGEAISVHLGAQQVVERQMKK